MSLEATIGLSLGELHIDVPLAVADDEVVTLLGPNGAGKTTILHALAGLQRLDTGRIAIDGECLDEPATGVFVPPHQRPIGVMFQDNLLFPRLSALDNVAFGLRARGQRRPGARSAAMTWLERLGLAKQAELRPAQLSGGQAQRVALARALAIQPRLLLLDEPLASLDAETRVEVRAELRRQLNSFSGTRILVTHDPVDALLLAERLVVVEDGQVTAAGRPEEVAARPRTPYIAELMGRNLWRGTADGFTVSVDGGGVLQVADSATGPVLVSAAPSALALHRRRPTGSARNVWQARVTAVEAVGERVRVRLEGAPSALAEVTPPAVADLGIGEGASVWISLKATELDVYSA